MRRDPVDIVHSLGLALKTAPPTTRLNVNEVASRAAIHWMTAKRYLELAQFIQESVPSISIEQDGVTCVVRILANPSVSELALPDQTLSFLAYFKAGTRANARVVPESLISTTRGLIEKGLIKQAPGGGFFLTPAGASTATRLLEPLAVQMDSRSPPYRNVAESSPSLREIERSMTDALTRALEDLTFELTTAPRGGPPLSTVLSFKTVRDEGRARPQCRTRDGLGKERTPLRLEAMPLSA